MSVGYQLLFDYLLSLTDDATTRRGQEHRAGQSEVRAARLCGIRRVPCRVPNCEECAQRDWDSPDSTTPALEHIDECGEDLSIDSGYERWAEYNSEIANGEYDDDEREAGEQQAAGPERLQQELRLDNDGDDPTTAARTRTSAADQPARTDLAKDAKSIEEQDGCTGLRDQQRRRSRTPRQRANT